jgi:hypothetical protein
MKTKDTEETTIMIKIIDIMIMTIILIIVIIAMAAIPTEDMSEHADVVIVIPIQITIEIMTEIARVLIMGIKANIF